MARSPLRCPHCDARDLYRSRRRPVEMLISRLGFYPFRCRACSRRSFHFAPGGTHHDDTRDRDRDGTMLPDGHPRSS